MMQKVKNLDIL